MREEIEEFVKENRRINYLCDCSMCSEPEVSAVYAASSFFRDRYRAELFAELIRYCELQANHKDLREGRKFWIGSRYWIEKYAEKEADQQ